MLLYSSQGFGQGLNPDCIKILLDRGASVMARNNWGETYLHLALRSIRIPESSLEKDSLLLLVKAGADVYATDYHGISVSDVVNTSDSVDRRKDLGTYRRDLWDEVFTECGYDPAAVHGQFQELEQVYSIKEEVSDIKEFSDSDERESMIEEQDSEMDGQDFKYTENTCDIIMEDDNIQYNSSSPVEDGLQLPRVMEETLDADIWSQTDSSMPEDSQ